MSLSSLINWLSPKARRADRAGAELKANAQKALRMKQEAEAGTSVPPHRTANEGMQPAPDPHMDGTRGGEAGFTSQLKRSRVARSGDAS